MKTTKYPINPDSEEYKHGYACFMTGRTPYYYPRTEYQKYKDQQAGFNAAKKDMGTSATKEEAYNAWRMRVMRSAIGKSEQEVRDIIRLPDGNIYRTECDAVMIKLSSTSKAFDDGRNDFLNGKGKTQCPYNPCGKYANYINWHTGFESTQLAVKLHGRQAVMGTL